MLGRVLYVALAALYVSATPIPETITPKIEDKITPTPGIPIIKEKITPTTVIPIIKETIAPTRIIPIIEETIAPTTIIPIIKETITTTPLIEKLTTLITKETITTTIPTTPKVESILDPEKEVLPVTKKPAMRIRITRKGVDYIHTLAMQYMKRMMTDTTLMEMTMPMTNGTLTTTANKMRLLVPPTYTYRMAPPNMIVGTAIGGLMRVTGQWRMMTTNMPTVGTVDQRGTYTGMMRNMNFTMMMRLVMRNERPFIEVMTCNTTAEMTNMTYDGDAPTPVMTAVATTMEPRVRMYATEQVCTMATQFINTRMNPMLTSTPTKTQIGTMYPFFMDYALMAPPMVTEKYIDMYCKGEVSWKGQGGIPIEPTEMPEMTTTEDRMIYMQGSDYVMNSFTQSAFDAGMTQMTVNGETMPEYASVLQTTCDDVCVGSTSEQLATMYPNSTVEFNLRATAPIRMTMTPMGIMIVAVGQMTAYVRPPTGTMMKVMTMEASAEGYMYPEMEDARIHANITMGRLKMTVTESVLTDVTPAEIEEIASMVMLTERPFFETMIRRMIGDNGIPLPMMERMTMVNPMMTMMNGAMMIGMDMEYQKV